MSDRKCMVDACGRVYVAKGLCRLHYMRQRNGTPLDAPLAASAAPVIQCSHCDRQAVLRGLCKLHHKRYALGQQLDVPPRRYGPVVGCSIDGCEVTASVKGMCKLHYHRAREGREMNPAPRPAKRIEVRTGYVILTGGGREGRKQYEHRVVMERLIGRPLLSHENVHHINGDRADNRPSNLEIWNTSQPPGQRVPDKVAWAIELLELYAPETLSGSGAQLRLIGREEGAA